VNIKNNFNINSWNNSYGRGENNILYPQVEVIKFLNKFIKKKINFLGDYQNILNETNNEKKLVALDFGCGVARHAILMEEFGIESYGLDISEEAIAKGRMNAELLGYKSMVDRLNVIKEKKILFKDKFFDFSIAQSSLDSMTFDNAKIFFKELSRVTKKYIHLTLIGSESSGDFKFVGDVTVKTEHEKGTIQSYYDLKKIRSLLDGTKSSIIFNRKVTEVSQIDNFVHSRFHLVVELQ